jgi:hypothetical protein
MLYIELVNVAAIARGFPVLLYANINPLSLPPTKGGVYNFYNQNHMVKFRVLATASMKMAVFWDVVPRDLVEVYRLIALMMEASSTSETSKNFYQTTRHSIPDDSHLQNYVILHLLKNSVFTED